MKFLETAPGRFVAEISPTVVAVISPSFLCHQKWRLAVMTRQPDGTTDPDDEMGALVEYHDRLDSAMLAAPVQVVTFYERRIAEAEAAVRTNEARIAILRGSREAFLRGDPV